MSILAIRTVEELEEDLSRPTPGVLDTFVRPGRGRARARGRREDGAHFGADGAAWIRRDRQERAAGDRGLPLFVWGRSPGATETRRGNRGV